MHGNDPRFSVENTPALEESPLRGKRILFLGSSVTFGSDSEGESMVDYLEKQDGILAVKEAVSGTTLADTDSQSYVARLLTMDTSVRADAFICQLSTNDATQGLPLGEIGDGENYDEKTVTGAMEFIIAYARRVWNCPVFFYTGSYYDSPAYEAMVTRLYELRDKWGIEVIDLWNDGEMRQVTEEEYGLYMSNEIHPFRAGYRDWWTPRFRKKLTEVLCR